MLRFAVSAVFFVAVCADVDIKYDVDQIRSLLFKNIECLESFPLLSENATFQLMAALGYSDFRTTVPDLDEQTANDVEEIQSRLLKMQKTSYDAYPQSPVRHLWFSEYWLSIGDFTFRKGEVKPLPKLKKSFYEIVQDTIQSPELLECVGKALEANPPSSTPRECQLSCLEDILDRNYFTRFTPEAKTYYVGLSMVLNCTNVSPEEFREFGAHICSYKLKEVEKMMKSKDKKIFDDCYYYVVDKVSLCAAYGLPELLNYKIIPVILGRIDCDGCVGKETHPPEVVQSLTAVTLVTMMNLYRYMVEVNDTEKKLIG